VSYDFFFFFAFRDHRRLSKFGLWKIILKSYFRNTNEWCGFNFEINFL